MKKILSSILIFIFTLIILDIILSTFLDKKLYSLLNIGGDGILKSGDVTEHFNNIYGGNNNSMKFEIGNNTSLEGLFWLPKNNFGAKFGSGSCKIYGLGDSITYGLGVNYLDTYLAKLSTSIKNTSIYNYGVTGYGIYQENIVYNRYLKYNPPDLYIWQFFTNDLRIYKYVFGHIYNNSLNIDKVRGVPVLSFIPENINYFLLQNSYLYNIILLKYLNLGIDDIVLNETYFAKIIEGFISDNKEKGIKILPIFTHGFGHKDDKGDIKEFIMLKNIFKKNNIEYIDLRRILKYDDYLGKVGSINDTVHFNKKGHQKVAKIIYDFILDNNLLNEKCY